MSRKYTILFTIIVIIQMLMLIHYMKIRTSLFYDEIWSYGMANSYDSPFLYDKGYTRDKYDSFYNHWIEGRRYFEYITVQPQERFAYNKVFNNQMADLHPPLYYMILHTICSFFPDSFSRWYGQIICLIVFVLAQIALFKLAKLFFDNDLMALLMCIFFGFSMAAVNNFIYIRMYCLATLWYLCITYIALKICKADQINKKNGWWLFLFGFLGFMTHNHFAIYYFCLCIGCGAYFIARKNYKLLLRFAGLAILSFVAYYVIFPGIFKQAHYLKMSTECGGILGPFPLRAFLANMAMICNYTLAISVDELIMAASKVVKYLGENVSFFPVWLFILVSFGIEYFCIIRRKLNICWVIFAITVCLYIVILSSYTFLARSGLYYGRYLFSILPCFALLGFGAIFKFVSLIKSYKLGQPFFIVLIMAISFYSHWASAGEWCFTIPPYREEIAERYKDISLIYVIAEEGTPDPLIHGKCQDFMYAKKVFTTRSKNTDCIYKAISECDLADKNYIILPATEAGKKIFKSLPALTGRAPVYLFTDVTNICTFYVIQL